MKHIIFDCDSTVGLPGKPMDDALALLYLLHPELYDDHPTHCYVTEKGMHSGWLGVTAEAPDTCLLNLPTVRDLAAYRAEMYSGWRDFHLGGNP